MKKTILTIASIALFISLFLLFDSCKSSTQQKLEAETIENTQSTAQENPYKDADIKAVIIPSEENTFGYDIYVQDVILIHQPSRPGVPGNLGFATKEDAMKVAELVIKKMRNNEMPPSVSMEELQELGCGTTFFY